MEPALRKFQFLIKPGLSLFLIMCTMAACSKDHGKVTVSDGDPERGKFLIQQYGCVACHAIPGIAHPGSNVGPPLEKMGLRIYIGGVLANTPENMIRWLQNPPAVDPRTAMPNLGVSEAEAKDITAYLYTLR